MTIDKLLGFEYTNNKGDTWKVINISNTNDKSKRKVTIQFSSGSEAEYSADHIISCINGSDGKNIESITCNKSGKDFIGKEFLMKCGNSLKITNVKKDRSDYRISIMEVVWDNNTIEDITLRKILSGTAKPKKHSRNNMQKITNDYKGYYGAYCKLPDGLKEYRVPEKFVNLHRNMMKRCYDSNNTSGCNNKSYINSQVVVHPDWFNLYNFVLWCNDNYIDGYQLDKDLLGNGKLYSKDTCVFIPAILNTLLTCKSKNDEYPLGVYKTNLPNRKPYPAAISVFGKKISLGYHTSIVDAFIRVKIAKEYLIRNASKYILKDSDHKIKSLVEQFVIYDNRISNPISSNDIIMHMKLNGSWTKSTSYEEVKNKFIETHKEEFQSIFDKIDVALNKEFSRP